MENAIYLTELYERKENAAAVFYRLFWIYVVCGVAGFFIESVWCWIDFQEFTSRTSNMFFPISCVWGASGVLLYLVTRKNRWNHGLYIFAKCTFFGAMFEFLCGFLGEHLLEVTFWDYSSVPLHIGKYINIPFCLFWGLFGILWVQKVCPVLEQKLEMPATERGRVALRAFFVFMVGTQLLTGAALLRMHERQQGIGSETLADQVMDVCFDDRRLQSIFPKMKSTVTGEQIYGSKWIRENVIFVPMQRKKHVKTGKFTIEQKKTEKTTTLLLHCQEML